MSKADIFLLDEIINLVERTIDEPIIKDIYTLSQVQGCIYVDAIETLEEEAQDILEDFCSQLHEINESRDGSRISRGIIKDIKMYSDEDEREEFSVFELFKYREKLYKQKANFIQKEMYQDKYITILDIIQQNKVYEFSKWIVYLESVINRKANEHKLKSKARKDYIKAAYEVVFTHRYKYKEFLANNDDIQALITKLEPYKDFQESFFINIGTVLDSLNHLLISTDLHELFLEFLRYNRLASTLDLERQRINKLSSDMNCSSQSVDYTIDEIKKNRPELLDDYLDILKCLVDLAHDIK